MTHELEARGVARRRIGAGRRELDEDEFVTMSVMQANGDELHAAGIKRYYEARAPEYDDWWLGKGLFAEPDRPGWAEEIVRLLGLLASLPRARTLDVACGTGFLTRHLHGHVVALDLSLGW